MDDGWDLVSSPVITANWEAALLNLKHCCVNQWLSEIRILASSMQGDSVPDAFMAI
jgi:hypothetical protein